MAESTPGQITPSGIETVTFWLVVQCLNQLRHHMPQEYMKGDINIPSTPTGVRGSTN